MKMISLLLALLIVGYLVMQQITKPETESATVSNSPTELVPPKVPQRTQDVPKFDQDINQFMDDAKEKRDKDLEQMQ